MAKTKPKPQPLQSTYYSEVMSTVSDLAPEAEKVLAWRQAEFRRFGYVDYVADFLAATRIDLTQIEDLIKRGCALDLAAQILMGTDWHGEDELWRWSDENLDEIVRLAQQATDREIEAVAV